MRPENPWWNFLAYYWVILIVLIILSHFNYYLRKLWLRRICLQCRRPGFHPCIRKIPWKREGQPTPVSLPGESHEQRSLEDHSPWGHKESNTTGWLTHTQENCKMHPFFLAAPCEILVPRPVIKFRFPPWERGVLTTGSPVKSHNASINRVPWINGNGGKYRFHRCCDQEINENSYIELQTRLCPESFSK